nr:vegetative cell wall protein gp1-like [Aegilops tauschii subsp. strangulata]
MDRDRGNRAPDPADADAACHPVAPRRCPGARCHCRTSRASPPRDRPRRSSPATHRRTPSPPSSPSPALPIPVAGAASPDLPDSSLSPLPVPYSPAVSTSLSSHSSSPVSDVTVHAVAHPRSPRNYCSLLPCSSPHCVLATTSSLRPSLLASRPHAPHTGARTPPRPCRSLPLCTVAAASAAAGGRQRCPTLAGRPLPDARLQSPAPVAAPRTTAAPPARACGLGRARLAPRVPDHSSCCSGAPLWSAPPGSLGVPPNGLAPSARTRLLTRPLRPPLG